MKAIVLAAGEGSRLRPLTDYAPKPLIRVRNKPLLSYCFDRLVEFDVDEIVTVIGPHGEQIVNYYGDRFGEAPLRYVVQEEPRGLADALLAAEEHLDGPFVLTYGDVIFEANLEDCLDHHRSSAADATLFVMDVPETEATRSGVCVTDDTGRVTAVIEKPRDPPTTLTLPGFFVFETVILHACHLVTPSERDEYELLDAIDLLVKAGRLVEPVIGQGWRVNVNTPADLERAEKRLTPTGDQS